MRRAWQRGFACLALVLLAACGGGGGSTIGAPVVATPTPLNPPVPAIAFTSIGPILPAFAGKINAFAQSGSVLLIASGSGTGLETYSSAGIYRSTNGSANWQLAMNGMLDASGRYASVVNALLAVPGSSTVFAGTADAGMFRSNDAGATWSNVWNAGSVTQLATYSGAMYAATSAGIISSTDNGATWTLQTLANGTPTAVAAVSGAMYAGTSTGAIYAYSNSQWMYAGTLPYVPGTIGGTQIVHQIAIDPLSPTTLYANENDGPWDQDLHASTDAGKTWNTVDRVDIFENFGLGAQTIAFSTLFPHQLYVGTDGALIVMPGDGSATPSPAFGANVQVVDLRNIWVSTPAPGASDDTCWIASDQGLDEVPNCANPSGNQAFLDAPRGGMSSLLARDFAISPDGATILTSLQDFDGLVSFNGGASWSGQLDTQTEFLYEDGFEALRPGKPTACYDYDEFGLNVSSDGCHSFPAQNAAQISITDSRLATDPMAFDPTTPTTMYFASTANQAFGAPVSIHGTFRSTDGGQTIAPTGWPFTDPGAIEIDPQNAQHIVVSDMPDGVHANISASFDGGATWTTASGVPSSTFWYSISISPVNESTILATDSDANNNVFVLRSGDGGRSFVQIANVTKAPAIAGRIGKGHAAYVYNPVRQIAFDPNVTSGTPYAVLTTSNGLYITADNGTTWERLDNALIAHSFWRSHWFNGYLYVSSDGQGILRSTTIVQAPSASKRRR